MLCKLNRCDRLRHIVIAITKEIDCLYNVWTRENVTGSNAIAPYLDKTIT